MQRHLERARYDKMYGVESGSFKFYSFVQLWLAYEMSIKDNQAELLSK